MNRIEQSLQKLFQHHRVIFWYDEDAKMQEEYENLYLEGVTKRVVENNAFRVKYEILHEAPEGQFLLYFPAGEPPYRDNWLLDLQLAHQIFHTDQEAMFLQELGLDYLFKDLVKAHLAFFQSKERRAKLRELIEPGDSEQSLRFKMLAVVFNTGFPNLEAYIQAYAAAFLAGDDRVDRELERFKLADFFWRAVGRKYAYQAEQPTIYGFLLEAFSRNFSLTTGDKPNKGTGVLLSLWKDARSHQEAFRKLSDRIAEDLQVKSLLEEATVPDILQDDLFQLIDLKIIYDLAGQLIAGELKLESLLSFCKARTNKYWYEKFAGLYACLEHAGQLLHRIRQTDDLAFDSVEGAAMQYAADLHLIDYHYRKFIYHHRATGQRLANLYQTVHKQYSNAWLLDVNHRLQDRINDMEQWMLASTKAQRGFFNYHVKSMVAKPNSRLFVLISDALRYENGWQLCQEIQAEARFEAELDYMITGLPSYTQLGMAALLPHRELAIDGKSGNVKADGMSTIGIPGRTKVLEANAGVSATAILAEDFMKMNSKTDGRAFIKPYNLIYIYHNRIDKTGDDTTTEDKVFEAVEDEIAFLKEVLRKIASMNGTHVFITADHGYLYQHEPLEENEFSEPDIQGDVWKTNRRFVLGKGLDTDNVLKLFRSEQLGLAAGTNVLIAKGINRLRVRGAGSRYVHGGASLQEIVIPLIKAAHKRKDTTSQVDIDIIKSSDKITTNILPVSFLQQKPVSEKVLPRQIRAFLQASDGTVLSDIFQYTFDATEGSERQREVKHRFQLTAQASNQYKNQRVALLLEEPIEGTSQWKPYKSYHYTLRISFTSDFDDF